MRSPSSSDAGSRLRCSLTPVSTINKRVPVGAAGPRGQLRYDDTLSVANKATRSVARCTFQRASHRTAHTRGGSIGSDAHEPPRTVFNRLSIRGLVSVEIEWRRYWLPVRISRQIKRDQSDKQTGWSSTARCKEFDLYSSGGLLIVAMHSDFFFIRGFE